jgi:predicted regulator of Ras-like GTPase activity (Roadblock/LC7/MglB family)
MTTEQDGISRDIFRGAERIEIFGKLPSLLWSYIDTGRILIQALKTRPDSSSESVQTMWKLLEILNSAAEHLENRELKDQLSKHSNILGSLNDGTLAGVGFIDSFEADLAKLEELAGQRVDPSSIGPLDQAFLDLELEKAEKIKVGRSPDLIVSVTILDDVKNYLMKEVMTEGISSILIIDNAGTLIVNVGTKPSLDTTSLAAVAAANYAATQQIARLIGERDFVLLFYKGHNESFHFSRLGEEYIIVTVFQNSLSLGLLRLKISEAIVGLEKKLPKREA